MTISSLLGSGATPGPVNRFELSGAGATGDGGILHYLDRGGGGGGHSHGGGGGGGKGEKGTRSAISALTLLAFLFFINLLQSCLKESMMSQSAMMMMPAAAMAAGRSRHTRDVADGSSVTNLEDINALPGPGVHWDSNVLKRGQKGDLEDDYDYDEDYQQNANDSTSWSRSDRVSFVDDNQLPPSTTTEEEEQALPSEESVVMMSTDRSYQHFSNAALRDKEEEEDWDYFQLDEDEGTRDLPTSDPTGSGFVSDRFEEADGAVLYAPTSLGDYAWRVVSSVSSSFMERVQSNLNIGQCSELVVCEAHRMGKAWGTSGMLLASGISEAILWLYGTDEEHRRLVMEAASTGREGHSCRMQMQQCEDKSRDRSALPFLATVLEQLV
ncbi:hypothetical protein C0J52_13637 [Blattella germanica]|nr:hypothetical protein C0J52_13637 [Blattella germanica]